MIGVVNVELSVQAHDFVNLAELLELLPAVADVVRGVRAELVFVADGDQERFGGEGVEQIPAVEAGEAGIEEVLFRVIGGTGRIIVCTGQILCIS